MTSLGDGMGEVTALLDRRLRVLRALCLALVGSVVLMAAVSVGIVQFGLVPPLAQQAQLRQLSLILSLIAVAIILVASRLYAMMMGRVSRGGGSLVVQAQAATVIDTYFRATLVSFALLEAIGLLGLVVAVLTGMLRHALVLCLVAALAMLIRWPRRGALQALLRWRDAA